MITKLWDRFRHKLERKHIQSIRSEYKQNPDKVREIRDRGGGNYIKSVIYGGLDGIITTFAVVMGVTGASLSSSIILIMGFANLIADGISMAIGDFLSSRAENELNRAEQIREKYELEKDPDGEKNYLVNLYRDKGLPIEDAQKIVEIFAKNSDVFPKIVVAERLSVPDPDDSPAKNALATFVSFSLFGLIPLVSFVIARFISVFEPFSLPAGLILTGLTLFTLGALKVIITNRNWFFSGLEMLAVGGIAAVAAFLVGFVLKGLV